MVSFYRQTSDFLCNQIFSRPFDVFLVKMIGFLLRKIYNFLMKAPRELLMQKHVVLPPMDVKVVCTHSEWNSVYRTLLEQCESIPVLGLDAEWISRFGRRYPVSLLQLAGKDGLCVLIRLNLLPKPFPASLKSLLADSSWCAINDTRSDVEWLTSASSPLINLDVTHSQDEKPQDKSAFKKKDSLRAHSLRAYNLRRNPLYDNCQLLAPDNQILCTCDSRKAKWYLHKGLGELVSENPLVIRLNFEPSGRPLNDEGYYQQEKENICVVCGKPENYLRKNIIPHEYRKYFPSIMKDHVSHDILLMCPTCHQKACLSDVTLRQKLAEECDAPLTAGTVNKSLIDVDLAKIRSAAKALMTKSHKIPDNRLKELHEFLKRSLGVEELTVDVLEKSVNMDVKINNPDYSPHGHQVIEYMRRKKQLLEFQLRWRQHFIDTMKPAYLPVKWAVDHNHKHLAPLLDEEIPKFTKKMSKAKSSKSSAKSKSKK
ncbi:exonuclease 3'-5' domain-containing protein 2 [Octopus bimaculoides]|nr:exonuclease 3'-5' domain-containing protein 2 [Octopus bimaculoides]